MSAVPGFGWRRRLPVILQTETIECGLACMVMIASYHGRHSDLSELRRRFPLSLNGTTLSHLMEIGAALGMRSRALRLEPEDLQELRMPCIVHWDMEHYVVLWACRRNGVVIHDPVHGRHELSHAEFSRHFTGIALELEPIAEFKPPLRPARVGILRLTGNLGGIKRSLGVLALLALCLETMALLAPLLVKVITDVALPFQDSDLLNLLGLGFLIMMVLHASVGALRSWCVARLGVSLNYGWSVNVFTHLVSLPQRYFERRQLGDLQNRFSSIADIQKTLTSRFIEGLLDGVMALLTLVLMLLYSPLLTVITVVSFCLYTLAKVLSFGWMREAQHGHLMSQALQQSHFLEVMRGMQAVRLNNRGAIHAGLYANKAVDTLNREIEVQRLAILLDMFKFVAFNLQRVLILWIGASMVLEGALTAGMLIAFFVFSYQFTTRAGALADYLAEFRMLDLHAERLADIVLETPEEGLHPQDPAQPQDHGLELRDVSFSYGSGEGLVLDHCNLQVRDGESVAITGASGCGKTTLIKVVVGLLDAEQGAVLVGGRTLQQIGKHALRAMVGTVMQDDQLFNGSILDNIRMFDNGPADGSAEEVARLAGVHEDIVAMPMGYYTLIGDMGSSLSGGQKQRIVLARALYKRPRILLLDEATSHLDVHREQQVNAALARLTITRVIIAHRPETIASAGRVLELRAGRLHEVDRTAISGSKREAHSVAAQSG